MHRRWNIAALLLGCWLIVSGCSSKTIVPVQGKITFAGQPVTYGSVIYEDATQGISVFSQISPDGSYRVTTFDARGLPPGKYRVGITMSEIGTGENVLVAPPTPPAPKPPGPLVPEKYWNPATSGLTAEVVPGRTTSIDFNLSE